MLVTEHGRLAEAEAKVIECDAAVHTAEQKLSTYLQSHPNSHAIHKNAGRISFKLDAMTSDLELSRLERIRDQALEDFHAALLDFANAKGGTHGK